MKRRLALAAVVVVGLVIYFGVPLDHLAQSARNKLAWQVQAGSPDMPDVMITMPDGIRLATDVYLPKNSDTVPAVLMRLPYDKRGYGEVRFWVKELTQRGFAVVAQDMRGRHGSEGVFAPYQNAGTDGVATLDWIIAQPWSNGKVGTLGCSALGESQLMLAAQRHPAHRAMVPIAAGGAIGSAHGAYAYFSAFEGGIPNLALTAGWFGAQGGKTSEFSGHYPIDPDALSAFPSVEIVANMRSDPTDYEAFLMSFETPDYWKKMGYVTGKERYNTPALFIDTWHDPGIGSTLALAKTVRDAGAPVSTIIAAGTHCGYLGTDHPTMVGNLAINPAESVGFVDTISSFLTHHLADGADPGLPYLSYYALNEDRWRSADDWPPQKTGETRLYLDGAGALLRDPASLDPSPRAFLSDPANPVPSIGGAICCTGQPDEVSGPVYQNAIEGRDDLLLYTSAPLENPLDVAGPLKADLRVSAGTPDTDIVMRLLDVDPDGNALLVQEGALRLRYRDGVDQPTLLTPGEVYDITVSLRDIAYRFKAGHSIRIHVAGSSFPRLERNLNTGRANYSETEIRPARITVHSESQQPSALVLQTLSD